VLSGDEFGHLFSDFEQFAYRLETLPEYRIAGEVERRAKFAAGAPPEPSPWVKTVAAATAAGRTVQRVRLVPELTDYLRFEFTWGYPFSSEAGERISVLEPAQVTDVDLPGDYWLFDGKYVVLMHYDEEGGLTRRELIEADVETYVRSREVAQSRAVPWAEWWSRQQG